MTGKRGSSKRAVTPKAYRPAPVKLPHTRAPKPMAPATPKYQTTWPGPNPVATGSAAPVAAPRPLKPKPGTYGAPMKKTAQALGSYGRKPAPALPGVVIPVPLAQKIKKLPPKPVVLQTGVLLAPMTHTIQGYKASDLEWRVYQTLHKLGWPESEIRFQADVFGNGGHLPGGILLDFVVFTPGEATVIEPSGDYWHTRTPQIIQRDKLRIAALQRATTQPFRYVSLASGELLTDKMAYNKLRLVVGRY